MNVTVLNTFYEHKPARYSACITEAEAIKLCEQEFATLRKQTVDELKRNGYNSSSRIWKEAMLQLMNDEVWEKDRLWRVFNPYLTRPPPRYVGAPAPLARPLGIKPAAYQASCIKLACSFFACLLC